MFLLQGIFEVEGHGIGEFRFWLAVVTGLLGGLYLLMLVLSHRRDRRLLLSAQSAVE